MLLTFAVFYIADSALHHRHLLARRRWPYTALTPVRRVRLLSATPTYLPSNDQTLRGSTMTSPLMIRGTTSIWLHHHRDLAITQLCHHNDFATVSTSFGALTHDMQDYDFKARYQGWHDGYTRVYLGLAPLLLQYLQYLRFDHRYLHT
jgi:hypothetical protein